MREPGVSRSLADSRAARVSDLRYVVHLTIPDHAHAPVLAALTLTFILTDTTDPLLLDFAPDAAGRLDACTINGVDLHPSIESEHVVLPASLLVEGRNIVTLAGVAGNAPLNRRDDHLYTIFVPARAREAIPCFDQPNLKARWQLTLDLPAAWTAVSNAREIARRPHRGAHNEARVTVAFAESAPLPSYLFAFAAGCLQHVAAEHDGRELRLFHTGVDAELVASSADRVLAAHADALRWLERYTATPYPFDTFDIVLLPAFQFSGMEHPGCIVYNASALLLPPSATHQQWLARAHVIAHETAHMWFGDLVTMTWFDDVWMKEVCANFMAAKIVNPQFPELDHDLRFLHGHYPGAYDVDRTDGAHAVRQPLANIADAGSLYGAIIYLKSPIVMRQLELMLGEEGLRDALRTYLARYRYGNAAWTDLLAILAVHAPIDLHAWSRAWLDEPGRPEIQTELRVASGCITRLSLRMREDTELRAGAEGDAADPRPRDDRAARPARGAQRLAVALGYGARVEHVDVWLASAIDVPEAVGRPAPDFVLPNGRGLAYGAFHLDPTSLAWLMAHLPEVADDLTRGSAWLTLWDAMLARTIAPDALMTLALQLVPLETNELNLQRLLLHIDRLVWIFLEPASRAAHAASLEAALHATLGRAANPTAKAALAACLRSVATTPSGYEWLEDLWTGRKGIDGLSLGEADRISLALELAVRGHADAVPAQLARMGAGDRRDALAFIAPALSDDVRRRDGFMTTLAQPGQRRREPWVIEGLRWLHHPLRAPASLAHLEMGLALLDDVQRTGDIFLPKRWLDAILGGHRTDAAAARVRRYLAARPDTWSPALRRMVLASADPLFRAVALSGDAARPDDGWDVGVSRP
jgi:aminopeptidase N